MRDYIMFQAFKRIVVGAGELKDKIEYGTDLMEIQIILTAVNITATAWVIWRLRRMK